MDLLREIWGLLTGHEKNGFARVPENEHILDVLWRLWAKIASLALMQERRTALNHPCPRQQVSCKRAEGSGEVSGLGKNSITQFPPQPPSCRLQLFKISCLQWQQASSPPWRNQLHMLGWPRPPLPPPRLSSETTKSLAFLLFLLALVHS